MTRPTSLAADISSLAAELSTAADDITTPPAGVAVAVRTGGVTTSAVTGARDAAASPMTIDTHHDLASVTKVVATTTSLLVLCSRGVVALDDPVVHYVGRFSAGAKADVTIRQLLAHRGGLAEWYPLYVAASDHAEALDRAARLDLKYPPGERRAYSDLGFILLGGVVEAVAGDRLDRAVTELVTAPLGLTSTSFAHPAAPGDVAQSAFDDRIEQTMLDTDEPYPVPHTSADFTGWRSGPIVGGVADGNAFHACGGVAGHAGLFSTIDDVLTWGAALAAAEPPADRWSADTAAEFFTPTADTGQALGFRRYLVDLVDDEPAVVLGHPGYVGCAAGFLPAHDVAVALATNRLITTGAPTSTETMFRRVLAATIPGLCR